MSCCCLQLSLLLNLILPSCLCLFWFSVFHHNQTIYLQLHLIFVSTGPWSNNAKTPTGWFVQRCLTYQAIFCIQRKHVFCVRWIYVAPYEGNCPRTCLYIYCALPASCIYGRLLRGIKGTKHCIVLFFSFIDGTLLSECNYLHLKGITLPCFTLAYFILALMYTVLVVLRTMLSEDNC